MTVEASAFVRRLLVACALAREAGQIAKRRFLDRSSFTVGFKGPQDYLTEVDGEVERLIADAPARDLSRRRLHRRGGRGAGRRRPARRSGWSIRSTAPRISPAACRISASRSPPCSTRQVEVGVIYDPMRRRIVRRAPRRRRDAQRRADPRVRRPPISRRRRVEVGWNMRAGADAFLGLLGRRRARPARR